jgi:hypothetical protein
MPTMSCNQRVEVEVCGAETASVIVTSLSGPALSPWTPSLSVLDTLVEGLRLLSRWS